MPDWGSILSGAGSGAAMGAMFGGGWGAIPGALIGGIYGAFHGKQQADYQDKVTELMAPSQYTQWGQTAAGKQMYADLMAQVNQNYATGKVGAYQGAAQNVQGRNMLSSTVLPYAQTQAMIPVEQARTMGTSQAGQIMGNIEAQNWQDYQQREFQKRLGLAGMWAEAGKTSGQNFGQFTQGLTNIGGQFLLNKYMPNPQYAQYGYR